METGATAASPSSNHESMSPIITSFW